MEEEVETAWGGLGEKIIISFSKKKNTQGGKGVRG